MFEVGDEVTWADGTKILPYYPLGILKVTEVSDIFDSLEYYSVSVKGKDGREVMGKNNEFVKVGNFSPETTLTEKEKAFLNAKAMIPDVTLDEQIQLAEWLMK